MEDKSRGSEVDRASAVLARMAATGHVLGCGEGWFPLISELDRQLANLDPAYGLFRVGRVDGALVFDAKPSVPELAAQFSALIYVTARRASAVCEVCGGDGELRTIHGLAEVLCAAHQAAAERAESRRLVGRKPMGMVSDQVP
ncbi:hypothetical protein [Nocardioides sp. WS12]|uniref:hypothetical protein n=1 Tax=Nocardioides sp. WS12 TaxID=2486272 RepID=UPI0015FCC781|nr:hypothetical protein [Nocardioides sp. WS12]